MRANFCAKQAKKARITATPSTSKSRFPVKGRPHIDQYRELAASTDKKKRKALNACCERCHLNMGYDGYLKASTCRDAVELAIELIAWAAQEEPVVV
jgi:hypothetical protein